MSSHGPSWRKSSFSPHAQNCVELADVGAQVLMRDSKHPSEGHLRFERAQLAALIAAVRAGEADGLI